MLYPLGGSAIVAEQDPDLIFLGCIFRQTIDPTPHSQSNQRSSQRIRMVSKERSKYLSKLFLKYVHIAEVEGASDKDDIVP